MKEKRFWNRLLLFFGVLLVMLAGCERKSEKLNEKLQGDMRGTELIISAGKDGIMEINKDIQEAFQENRPVDLTDYSSYLKKIWIVDGWEEKERRWDFPISLVFTKAEGGAVEGYFYMEGMISIDYFRILELKHTNLPRFQGTVYDGTAECEYENDDGGKGTFSLTFCGDDWIEARLGEDENQCYLLRPYNISDENLMDNQVSYEVELDSWGTVNLFYANSDDNHSFPQVFLINEQRDILYQFLTGYPGYQTASEVLEIIVEDMNGDGLKDVEVVTYFSDIPDIYRFEWYFYQGKNGFFYHGLTNMYGV